MKEGELIFVVTTINGTEVIDTHAFTSGVKSKEFYTEESEKYFGDRFEEVREMFPEDATCEDYQFSEWWWDSGERLFITLDAVLAE